MTLHSDARLVAEPRCEHNRPESECPTCTQEPETWPQFLAGFSPKGESTAEFMRRTDPVAYEQCRDAGRL